MNPDVKKTSSDEREPSMGHGAVFLPMWLVGLLGFLIYWSCNFIDQRSGKFNELVYEPYLSTNELGSLNLKSVDVDYELGRVQFKTLCAPCHQESGLGSAGLAPPLVASDWVTAVGPNRIIRLVQTGVAGPIKVKDVEWNLVMPPMGATLEDKQLAAVLYYVRNSWGNKGSKVTADQVKKVRTELGGRSEPHTAEELLKLPDAM